MTYREKYGTFAEYEHAQALKWFKAETEHRAILAAVISAEIERPAELIGKTYSELLKMFDEKNKSVWYLTRIVEGKTHSPLFRRLWNSLADTEVRK